MRPAIWLALALVGCQSPTPPSTGPAPSASEHFVLAGGDVLGLGIRDIEVRGGKIVAVGSVDPAAPRVDIGGRFVVPAFIDSHVHLSYLPRAEQLARGGLAAAVDLAAPKEQIGAHSHAPLRVLDSGPMLTAPGGYPLDTWGRAGYGLPVMGVDAARDAVGELAAKGAQIIKVPIGTTPGLSEEELRAVVEAAHARKLKVVAHALSEQDVDVAARVGVDALAHTPTAPLSTATLDAWSNRTVISTLSAFGGEDNLAALRAHGARVLYGTDFGNTRALGISAVEIASLRRAGLSGSEIVAAATKEPAAYWGIDDLGAVAPHKRASLLVLGEDPRARPEVLAEPERVYLDGKRL